MHSGARATPLRDVGAQRRRGGAASAVMGVVLGALLVLACDGESGRGGGAPLEARQPSAPAREQLAARPTQRSLPPLPNAGAVNPANYREAGPREAAHASPGAIPSGAEAPGAAVRPSTSSSELEPGGNDEFDPALLADPRHALGAENESAFATLVHEKKAVLPRNCREWRTFRRRGFAPKASKHALPEHVDAGALVRCGSLEFLARAAPSRVSYVRGALPRSGLADLPAVVASATSRPALLARNAAVARGLTLAEFLPTAHVADSELRGRLTIVEPASETSVILNAEVWGDINGDGIEDLLLSVLNSAEDGSYFDMRLIEVTRTLPDAPLRVLAVQH